MKKEGKITDHLKLSDEGVRVFKQYKHNDTVFKFGKRYSEMNRKEKREYKRWLKKTEQWDSEVWLTNIELKTTAKKKI